MLFHISLIIVFGDHVGNVHLGIGRVEKIRDHRYLHKSRGD